MIVQVKWRGGMKNRHLSSDISLYFENDTRYDHSYNGSRLGIRMRSIEWCNYQWPWTTPHPDFKVTPIFDTESSVAKGLNSDKLIQRLIDGSIHPSMDRDRWTDGSVDRWIDPHIHPSIDRFIDPSLHLSIHFSIHLCIFPPSYTYMYLSSYLSTYLPTCLPTFLVSYIIPIYLFCTVGHPFVSLFIYLSLLAT